VDKMPFVIKPRFWLAYTNFFPLYSTTLTALVADTMYLLCQKIKSYIDWFQLPIASCARFFMITSHYTSWLVRACLFGLLETFWTSAFRLFKN
jgi:hypothetical protein